MSFPPIHRVVTGHNAQGEAVVVSDGPLPTVAHIAAIPGTVFHEVWSTHSSPARLDNGADPTLGPVVLPPPAQGTRTLDVIDPSTEQTPEQATELEALRRAVMQQFDQYVKLNKKIPPEILTSIASIDDPGRLADTIAAHLPLKLENKQVVLDLSDVKARLENLFEQLDREVDILNVDKKIRGRVKRQMEKNQRDFYLNEQVKAIQKELGEGDDGADIEEIEKKIKLAKMPAEARKKAEAELKKLKLMSPMSAEASVVRNYIDVLTALPWAKKTKIKHDLVNAEGDSSDGK